MFREGFTLRVLEVAGACGRYLVRGCGSPVVLLGSTLARVRPYRDTIRQLAQRHRVYAFEMPGSGAGSRVAEPWSLEQYAAWAAAALEALDLRDVTLIGHSHAGGVALVLAASQPARLGRLVIVDAIGAFPQSWTRLARVFVPDVLTEFRLAVRESSCLAFGLIHHTRNFRRLVRTSLEVDLMGYASRVAVPTLVGWGTADHTLPLPAARAFASRLPKAEVHLSPGGHCWLITHAAEFADAVEAFASRTTSAPSPGAVSATAASRRRAVDFLGL